MTIGRKPVHYDDLQTYRDEYIKKIDEARDKTKFVSENSQSLFSLGLTMYSKNYDFDSLIYNSFSLSELDENISLHPEQQKVINLINENKGIIFSAPTSFGKTFVVFEYIAKYKPKTVVLVVPTLALIDEYKRKIIKQFRGSFSEYNVYLSIDEEKNYNFEKNNIFIVTHDRVVNENTVAIFKRIDLLVIDEVYKLQKDEMNDRVLILNLAYYNMVKKSIKYILLAPFISGVKNLDQLEDTPKFYNTNFSPVVNKVITYDIIDDDDRIIYTDKILEKIPENENTLIYFPTVVEINNFIENTTVLVNKKDLQANNILTDFVNWARTEIHEEWSLLKAIENGYLVHHGQLPLGIRMLQLDLFNHGNNMYNKMICTSTLLEGVNTNAKHIIITKPARGYNTGNFDAFDFYNLVGRTGRLYQHYLGLAHYIKGPRDPNFTKDEALKSIQFELTDDSIDIGINCNDYAKYPEFVNFLSTLKTDYETYKREVAAKCRFRTVLQLYNNYKKYRTELLSELHLQLNSNNRSKLGIIRCLYLIITGGKGYKFSLLTFIINKLTYLKRMSIREIIEDTKLYYSKENINNLIGTTIRLKTSYIEYEFYNKISVIRFFMECESIDGRYIDIIHDKLLKNIEIIYYVKSPSKKMLKDMGIYDGDIDNIIRVIGDKYESISELQKAIKINIARLGHLSIISRYVINNLIS
ncbi:DEAD/DEAH box helicase [Heliobacillus mobilis]|uniref:DEAD/DEAH box helicase n=1 Tax=Heliobacterium mobile TaxID=28064 RepID=A0A6I3SNL4_HELMO|nr:DEAD/DEAH box helicase [Heliobacterium mobile]MTV50630.1 DEAD/DEAH box helicase [Heliobacterium mobile]